ncbi:MAG: DegV family protein [Hyphomicrobiales bacterium]
MDKLSGRHLFYGFISGAHNVISRQDELNKINIFPVADSDTGTNLGNTFRTVLSGIRPERSYSVLLQSIASNALVGARGNSGVIFAQFLYGLSIESIKTPDVCLTDFAGSLKKTIKHVYDALTNPVEGTILTVIREWSEYFYEKKESNDKFIDVFEDSLIVARESLNKTSERMEILRKKKLVDAGAKGFVLFLEGIMDYFKTGKVNREHLGSFSNDVFVDDHDNIESYPDYRFCTEVLIQDTGDNIDYIRGVAESLGDSVAIAGGKGAVRLHVHTSDPDILLHKIKSRVDIISHKVDDMVMQYEISNRRNINCGIIIDSTCDLPVEIKEKYHIQMVPLSININGVDFLDGVTVKSTTINKTMHKHGNTVSSAQAPLVNFKRAFSLTQNYFPNSIGFFVSSKLSGTFNSARLVNKDGNYNVDLVDTKMISGCAGMLAYRFAAEIEQGVSYEDALSRVEEWKEKSRLLVYIPNVNGVLKSGRVPRLKGIIAKFLGLKPILSIDGEGKGSLSGIAFTRKKSINNIMKDIKSFCGDKEEIWDYIISYTGKPKPSLDIISNKMIDYTGKKPAGICETSPVLSLFAGLGCVCVSVMLK